MKKKNSYSPDSYFKKEPFNALDAKFEAQKIAFGPYVFQAALAMRDLGLLDALDKAGNEGVTRAKLASSLNLSDYAVGVLLEMGLSSHIVKINPQNDGLYVLGKTGFFLLHDALTIANMDFMQDVCYKGAFYLKESLLNGKPEGLKIFGDWDTVYQGLSSLPAQVQKSWFAFDHFYSDGAFPQALDFVFRNGHKSLMDIGGNTAKWALSCVNYDPRVQVTIVDLPGQANMARKRIQEEGFDNRIDIFEADMLQNASELPKGMDAVWMSQFLDCFSLKEVQSILKKVYNAIDDKASVYVMEPLWDKQRYEAAAYSLHATSLYFTNIANGNSKMYKSEELIESIESSGFKLSDEIHQLGPNDYSILQFSKVKS